VEISQKNENKEHESFIEVDHVNELATELVDTIFRRLNRLNDSDKSRAIDLIVQKLQKMR